MSSKTYQHNDDAENHHADMQQVLVRKPFIAIEDDANFSHTHAIIQNLSQKSYAISLGPTLTEEMALFVRSKIFCDMAIALIIKVCGVNKSQITSMFEQNRIKAINSFFGNHPQSVRKDLINNPLYQLSIDLDDAFIEQVKQTTLAITNHPQSYYRESYFAESMSDYLANKIIFDNVCEILFKQKAVTTEQVEELVTQIIDYFIAAYEDNKDDVLANIERLMKIKGISPALVKQEPTPLSLTILTHWNTTQMLLISIRQYVGSAMTLALININQLRL